MTTFVNALGSMEVMNWTPNSIQNRNCAQISVMNEATKSTGMTPSLSLYDTAWCDNLFWAQQGANVSGVGAPTSERLALKNVF